MMKKQSPDRKTNIIGTLGYIAPEYLSTKAGLYGELEEGEKIVLEDHFFAEEHCITRFVKFALEKR
ncbi:unnamed protein product [Eruca vesicaria subsp. sativa]|uniref:Protein kinase domain-containing protein n=1 Tax=Eruca vesicaria subsp. sativa TaxID=29727 RepID=A0ABC8KT31_ERUVS|nr:unnamed protein product [Eruca vesicaria subsp. sativa]